MPRGRKSLTGGAHSNLKKALLNAPKVGSKYIHLWKVSILNHFFYVWATSQTNALRAAVNTLEHTAEMVSAFSIVEAAKMLFQERKE